MHDVVAAVLLQDRHVLLVHRSPTRASFPDVWDLPGGHIEAGESTGQAITRELCEELGIVVHLAHVETLAQPLITSRDLRLSICRIHCWRGEPVNACPTEHDQIGWFTLGDLSRLDLAHPALTDLLSGMLMAEAYEDAPRTSLSGPAATAVTSKFTDIDHGRRPVLSHERWLPLGSAQQDPLS